MHLQHGLIFPGEKAITRQDACVLNRIAQLLCGPGAAEIDYRGIVPAGLNRLVEKATSPLDEGC